MSGKIVVKLDIAQILKVFIVNYTQWKPQVNHGSKLQIYPYAEQKLVFLKHL